MPDKDWLEVQLKETEKLLERCSDSPIMKISLENRIVDIKKQLLALND